MRTTRTTLRTAAAALGAALALVLTGCGGDTVSGTATAASSSAATPEGASAVEDGVIRVPAEYGGVQLPAPPEGRVSSSNVVGESWGVYLYEVDPAAVLDFYRGALSTAGWLVDGSTADIGILAATNEAAAVTVAEIASDTVELSVRVAP